MASSARVVLLSVSSIVLSESHCNCGLTFFTSLVYFRTCSFGSQRAVSVAHIRIVYPETMGVPLEEMDAVFGEGSYQAIVFMKTYSTSKINRGARRAS